MAFGINLIEGTTRKHEFQIVAFYPGPPPPGVNE
jgi:hypothetical protein